MASVGLEWETSALISDLPPESSPGFPLIEEKDWSLSVEKKEYTQLLQGISLKSDKGLCGYNLEAQIGPSFSNDSAQFNISGLKESISNFTRFWNRMVETQKLTARGVTLPVITYAFSGKDRYQDCDLTVPGVNPGNWGFVRQMGTIYGKVQMTVGLRLSLIPKLFRYLTKLILACYHPSKCDQIPRGRLLPFLKAYFSAQSIMKEKAFSVEGQGFLLLVLYFIHVAGEDGSAYFKSRFAMKIRTNLGLVFASLSQKDQSAFETANLGVYVDQFESGPQYWLRKWLVQLIKPRFTNVEMIQKGEKAQLSRLNIYVPPDIKLLQELDSAGYRFRTIKTSSYDPDGRGFYILKNARGEVYTNRQGPDEQEWVMGENQTIYLEFRSPESLLALIRGYEEKRYLEKEEYSGYDWVGRYSLATLPEKMERILRGLNEGLKSPLNPPIPQPEWWDQ